MIVIGVIVKYKLSKFHTNAENRKAITPIIKNVCLDFIFSYGSYTIYK